MTYESSSDPAHDAMASPESPAPKDPIYVVGIGPGNPAFLTPRGKQRITQADVVLGFETVVDYVRSHIDGEVLPCSYDDEREMLTRFAEIVEEGNTGTIVMMGDPNFSDYQFLGKIERAVDRPVRVIPGISSLQVAASRARTPMEETTFVTLHKSGPIETDLDRLIRDVGERHLLVLPRPFDWMPEEVADFLLDNGAADSLDTLVFERLTHNDETVTRSTLGELAQTADGDDSNETRFSDLSILAIRKRPP